MMMHIARSVLEGVFMSDKVIDQVEPGKRWEFNGEVAACFDDMLRRSIPTA